MSLKKIFTSLLLLIFTFAPIAGNQAYAGTKYESAIQKYLKVYKCRTTNSDKITSIKYKKVYVYYPDCNVPGQKPEVQEPTKPEVPEQKPEVQEPINVSVSAFEKKVVDLVNQERAKAGLQPLKINTTLVKTARVKSQDMADKNYFAHESPTYGSPFDLMKKYGVTYRTAGENIAAGQSTPENVMNAWMNSPGHKANILNENFTEIGVGFVKGGSYGYYWTQHFIGK